MPEGSRDALNLALAKVMNAPLRAAWSCPVHGLALFLDQDDEGYWRCGESGSGNLDPLGGPCWQRAVLVEFPTDYCGSLDAAADALNALGLDWAYYPTHGSVHVMAPWDPDVEAPRCVIASHAVDRSPAALATALVQAALKVLAKEAPDA